MTRTPGVTDFVEWDVPNWSIALDFWTRHSSRRLEGCRALELGSRNGGLSLWLALNGAEVVCSDVRGPSQRAARSHREAGVESTVRYEAIDATHIPYEAEFDFVVFKSMLGAVGARGRGASAQAAAIAEMHKALKPGGELLFAENLVGSPLHQYLRRRFISWGNSWRYVSVTEMREFLHPFRHVEFCTAGVAGVLGRSPRQRNMLGGLDRAVLNHVVPGDWRYMIAGVATK